MRMMTDEEDRRMTLLEMQVGALITQREEYAARVQKLREYIAENSPHSGAETNCPACRFLKEDAS